ncbi:MAG: hypothetical protein FJZ00_07275 [Candidatus Sericytochromatia bacterium]|uniref:Uncharacterized protein n=1 Tax=Candidatus Tanganyikabacteria bacterium TaxID=2961651 RepID=A0A937X7B2_9BACT|nr:hypothetical protein [Candidatus Tanganyikabacteria bacterium]
MPLYDSFVARLKCWNCGIMSLPELQTATLKAPGLRDLKVGDKAELKPSTDLTAYTSDIVFKQPDTDGYCNFMMGWSCSACKLVNWVLVSIQDHSVVSAEMLRLDAISIERVHVLSWDKTLDEFMFQNRGMSCSLKKDLEVVCTCERDSGQVAPFFGLEDVVFEGTEETEAGPSSGRELIRRVGPQVVFQEIREKMAVTTEQQSFGRYDVVTLKKELINADREYRATPQNYPRRLKVYGKLPQD